MKWLFLLAVIVLIGCGDERGGRDIECDDAVMLADAEASVQRANEKMMGYNASLTTGIIYEHLCNKDYGQRFDAWCWWEVDSTVDEKYCYQGIVCRPIADQDVESKRAELCK